MSNDLDEAYRLLSLARTTSLDAMKERYTLMAIKMLNRASWHVGR